MSQQTVKQRLACYRCHSHKMRCINVPGSTICARCEKAGAECVFGQSRRGCRPSRKNLQQQEDRAQAPGDRETEKIDSNFDLLSFMPSPWDFSPFTPPSNPSHTNTPAGTSQLPTEPSNNSQLQQLKEPRYLDEDHVSYASPSRDRAFPNIATETNDFLPTCGHSPPLPNAPRPATTNTTHPESTALDLDRRLARLSERLANHLSSIPRLDAWSSSPNNPFESVNFSVTDTFTLTQDLIESSHDLVFPVSDSSIYILLACYHRVLDIWEMVFGHMRACIAMTMTSASDLALVPAVMVGSYMPSTKARINIHLTLVDQFAIGLQGGCQKILGEVSRPPIQAMHDSTRFTEVWNNEITDGSAILSHPMAVPTSLQKSALGNAATILSCEAVVDRSVGMTSSFNELKDLMQGYLVNIR